MPSVLIKQRLTLNAMNMNVNLMFFLWMIDFIISGERFYRCGQFELVETV